MRYLLCLILAVPLVAGFFVAAPSPVSACSLASPPGGETPRPTLTPDDQDRRAGTAVHDLLNDPRLLIFQAHADLVEFRPHQIPVQTTYILTVTRIYRGNVSPQVTYIRREYCGGGPSFSGQDEYVVVAHRAINEEIEVLWDATRPTSRAAHVLQELGLGIAVTPAARRIGASMPTAKAVSVFTSRPTASASIPAPLLLVGIGGVMFFMLSVLVGLAFVLRRA